jgi:hypothetical protein
MTEFPVSDPGAGRGPTLYGLLYASLWLQASLLAALVLRATHGRALGWQLALWTAGLGLLCAFTASAWILIHDFLITLNYRERAGLAVLVLALFLMPIFFKAHHIVPEGFLWAAPFVLLISVTPSLTRRGLAWMLLGGWFAAYGLGEPRAWADLAWTLAFATSWLAALGAAHFCYTGAPHGLEGWWPARRLMRNVAATIPAALLAAWLVFEIWPAGTIGKPRPAGAAPVAPHPLRTAAISKMNWLDLLELLWQGVLTLMAVGVLLAVLVWARRWLLARGRPAAPPDLIDSEVARLAYRQQPPPPPAPELPGARGKIVRLWGQWAAAMARAGFIRAPGETAAQFARRLRREGAPQAPPEQLTQLLERAHYAPQEPSAADLAAMRALVHGQLLDQRLREDAPVDPMARDDEE